MLKNYNIGNLLMAVGWFLFLVLFYIHNRIQYLEYQELDLRMKLMHDQMNQNFQAILQTDQK